MPGLAMMDSVLSVMMNDAAVEMVGVLNGVTVTAPPDGMALGLQERLARGIVRRGDVLTWAGSTRAPERTMRPGDDLTGWESTDSSFHLEDSVPVAKAIVDGAPMISEDGQRTLLLHGIAFALEFSRLVYSLDPTGPVRCILAANETNATFRFHQIRPGELWNLPDLDGYRHDRMVVLDIQPAPYR